MAANMTENSIAVGRIRAFARRSALPHALILSGSGNRLEAARYTAAAMLCSDAGDKPCLLCNQCRKVLAGIHPDVLMVEDDERKELRVEDVRDLRTNIHIRPNEGARKVAIFPRAEQLNERDQNVLLKIIEEGPPYAAFFFCAETSALLLPTVRSRCTEFKLSGEDNDTDYSQAQALCHILKPRHRAELTAFFIGLEVSKVTRDEVFALLAAARDILSAALAALYGKPPSPQFAAAVDALTQNLTKKQIVGTIEMLEKYSAQSRFNVGVGHLAGALAAELEAILD